MLPRHIADERDWPPVGSHGVRGGCTVPSVAVGVIKPRPFPLGDLERLLAGRCGPTKAALLGIRYRQLCRPRLSGLTIDQADDLDVAAGCHPSKVWPAW